MNKIFSCKQCGESILVEEGRVFFAGIWFDCYTCENCGNKILLESKNQGICLKMLKIA